MIFRKFFFIVLLLLPVKLFAEEEIAEDFNSLKKWEPLVFPKIKRHTNYKIIALDSKNNALYAETDNAASGLVSKNFFNVESARYLRWRWKVDNVYKKGNAKEKSGDDYPLRLYVAFEFDPEEAGTWELVKFRSYKALYGEYPPKSLLNYIWASRLHDAKIITNSYTDRAMMVVLQEGEEFVGQWRTAEVDILDDYIKAFGESPPKRARLAIMSDSDDTEEQGRAYLDYIYLSSKLLN